MDSDWTEIACFGEQIGRFGNCLQEISLAQLGRFEGLTEMSIFVAGRRHNSDRPCVTHTGCRCWYLNGFRDRDGGGPAYISANGDQYWYKGGALHREGGPAIVQTNGNVAWFVDDERHREDGPAIMLADGSMSWFKNDKCHREGGPALICVNGGVLLRGQITSSGRSGGDPG